MIKSIDQSGLQTLALPSYKNKPQDIVNIIVYVGTCIDIDKSCDANELNARLVYAPSHLIEHTVAIQNDVLYNQLRQENKMKLVNAYTDITKTFYVFQVKADTLKTSLPIILDSIYKLKLDANIYKPEQEVIDHEFYSSKLDNLSDNDLILDSKSYEKVLSTPNNENTVKEKEKSDNIANELMHQNLSKDFLQNYYEKHYVPENSVVSITNCDQDTYEDFQDCIHDYFQSYPKKEPVVSDMKKYRAIYAGDYTDNVIDSLFECKYKIFELKDRLTDRSKYQFFFKFPNMDNKYSMVSELYKYIFSKPDAINFNDKDLIYYLRRKRHLVYTPKTNISNFYSKDKTVMSLEVNSNCINTHKVMTGVRGLVNKIAFNNILSSKDFKEQKEKFKHYYLVKTYYNEGGNAVLDYNVTALFSGDRHIDMNKEIKMIDKIRYEDFMNFAKYVAKTDDYSIIAYGNSIEPSTLTAFELKNKQVFTNRDSSKYTGNQEPMPQRPQFLIAKELPPAQDPRVQTNNDNTTQEK